MRTSRIVSLFIAAIFLLIVIASRPQEHAHAQVCYDPNQKQIPCPEKRPRPTKTATDIPPTRTFTPTQTSTATSTFTPTLTPSATLVPVVMLTCDATPKTGSAPLSVKFTSSPGGGTGVYGFRWDFGESDSSSSEQSPTFVYKDPGSYFAVVRLISPPQDSSNPQPGTFADCRVAVTVTEATLTATPTGPPVLGFPPFKPSDADKDCPPRRINT